MTIADLISVSTAYFVPDCSWITRHFHEKAGPCQGVFLVVPTMRPTADQREAQFAFSLSFLICRKKTRNYGAPLPI